MMTDEIMLLITPLKSCSYESLVQHYPDVPEYRLYYAQVLYNAGQYEAAQSVAMTIERPEDAVPVGPWMAFDITFCSLCTVRSRSFKRPSSSRPTT